MFRAMRRSRQELSEQETREILEKGTSGVLALMGDEGYPYALPISYALDGKRLIFHSAKTGHKIDAIKRCAKASFCVIDRDDVVPEKFSTLYRSAIAFGQIRVLEGQDALEAIEKLAVRYNPQDLGYGRAKEIEGSKGALCVLELRIEHLSGKQSKALCSASL